MWDFLQLKVGMRRGNFHRRPQHCSAPQTWLQQSHRTTPACSNAQWSGTKPAQRRSFSTCPRWLRWLWNHSIKIARLLTPKYKQEIDNILQRVKLRTLSWLKAETKGLQRKKDRIQTQKQKDQLQDKVTDDKINTCRWLRERLTPILERFKRERERERMNERERENEWKREREREIEIYI